MSKKEKNTEPKIKDKKSKTHETSRNALDNFENQKFADDIPLDDLKIETDQERDKRKTQDDSQSEEKYDKDL